MAGRTEIRMVVGPGCLVTISRDMYTHAHVHIIMLLDTPHGSQPSRQPQQSITPGLCIKHGGGHRVRLLKPKGKVASAMAEQEPMM
jgi:hypothetical protein